MPIFYFSGKENYLKKQEIEKIEKAEQAYSGSNYILNNVITLNLICFLCCEMHKYITRKSKTLPDSDMSLIRALQFIEKTYRRR